MIVAMIGIYIGLILLSIYFSGSEAGFVGLNTERYHQDLHEDKKLSKPKVSLQKIAPLVGNIELVLGVTLLGNNLANIAAIYVGERIWSQLFHQNSLLLFTGLSTVIFLVFCEVLPKIFFRKYANPIMYRIGISLLFFERICRPFVYLITLFSNALTFPFKSLRHNQQKLSKEDIHTLLEDVGEGSFIRPEEKPFFNTLSSLSTTKVAEIMTPLVDLFFLSKNQTISTIKTEIIKAKQEILPVYEMRIDNIVGLIDCVDVFNSSKSRKIAKDLMQEVVYFPETNTLDKLYLLFSQTPVRSVVAVDEYGGCTGIVHEKDIVGHLFGFQKHITKERRSKEKWIKPLQTSIYEVDPVCELSVLNKQFGWNLSREHYTTLGGYVNNLFGYIPKEGETNQTNIALFRIMKASKTGVEKVHIEIKK